MEDHVQFTAPCVSKQGGLLQSHPEGLAHRHRIIRRQDLMMNALQVLMQVRAVGVDKLGVSELVGRKVR